MKFDMKTLCSVGALLCFDITLAGSDNPFERSNGIARNSALVPYQQRDPSWTDARICKQEANRYVNQCISNVSTLLLNGNLDFDNLSDGEKNVLFLIAQQNNRLDIMNDLLKHGNINGINVVSHFSLARLINERYEDVAKYSIQNGADINEVSVEGLPLNVAIFNDLDSIVKLLLEQKNLEINKKDRGGQTALWVAVKMGRLDFIELLKEHGADFSMTYENGNNLLHKLINFEDLEKLMKDRKCYYDGLVDIDKRDRKIRADERISLCKKMVKALLKYEPDLIKGKNEAGKAPIDLCPRKLRREMFGESF